ncbi:hypothetical protein [Tsukamurella pseudospumae]|uniref:ABC transporter permease n=1 Tax=Tsukamurella pseudospumae TaxID=239498 RepID=A0A138AIC0_9ACTN|nr:hypothetical protein [Tsukamurella pseudospumae]KXP10157.1 hypothetical protein AXK60_06660 [Tsukamurella pseudospumae]
MIVRAIRAEFVKLTSVRATRWLLIGSTVFSLGITLIVALVMRSILRSEEVSDEGVIAFAPFTGFGGVPGISIVFAAIIGVLSVTTEIRFNTLRTTFLAVPNRWVALLAKTSVVVVVCAVVHLLALLVGSVLYGLIAHGSLFAAFRAGDTTLLTFPVAVAFATVLGVATGAALRNGAGAIALLLGYLFVVDNVISQIPQTHDAAAFLPFSNLQNLQGVLLFTSLPWGAPVSFLYLLVVVGALWTGAVALLARRDA